MESKSRTRTKGRAGIAPAVVLGLVALGLVGAYFAKQYFADEGYASTSAYSGPAADPYYPADGTAAWSPSDAAPPDGRRPRRGPPPPMIDTDGDGQVSETERAAARASFEARFDKDGDGTLSEEERAAMPRPGHRPMGPPPELLADPELGPLFEAVRAAHRALEEAAKSGDTAAAQRAREALEAARAALDAKRQAKAGG